MDGVACQIAIGNVFNDVVYMTSSFVKVDSLLRDVNWAEFHHTILTDVYPTDPSILDRIENLIFLDHHDTSLNSHDPKRSRFVDPGQCASSLTKRFLEEYFSISMPYLDEFMWHVNNYDLWVDGNPVEKAKQLNTLWSYYREVNFRKRFMSGDISFTEEENRYLEYKRADYNEKWDGLSLQELEYVNGCIILNAEDYINEFCHDLMTKDKYKLVFFRNAKNGRISVRHCIDGLHMGNLLDKMEIGGGHANSAGLHEMDIRRGFRDMQKIEEHVFTHFKDARRKGK